jgi:dTDP-4-dehydrorhamnose reductase
MSTFQSIVITGGGGMLARALLSSLRQRGHVAVALDRKMCDVSDEGSLRAQIEQHRPTLLLNCAAHTKVDQCEDEPQLADAINGHAVGMLAKLASEFGTFLVHFSTDFVFDGHSSRPYLPNDATHPLSVYGRSKLLGETLLQEHAPARWLVLRTAWLYGPGGASFPRTIVNVARAGKPLMIVNDQIGSPTFTGHLAEATVQLVEKQALGLHHVTNSGQTSWHDFAVAVLREFGVSANLSAITTARWKEMRPKQAVRPAYSVLSDNDLTHLLGRPMPSWQAGLSAYRQAIGDGPL